MTDSTETSSLNGGCLARLRTWTKQGKGSVASVSRFVLENPELALNVSINEFAERAGVGVSSISRFCTNIGYSGYKEFQLDLAASLVEQPAVLGEFDENASPHEVMRQVFACNRHSITETEKVVHKTTFVEVARHVHEANRVYLLGVGMSGLVAQQAATRFMSLGLTASALTDPYLQVFVTENLGKSDVVLAISHTGLTRSVVESVETARKCSARTVAVTNYPQSPLAKACDFLLTTSFEERRANAAVSSSHIAQLCLLDALYFVVGNWRSRGAIALADQAEKRVQQLLR